MSEESYLRWRSEIPWNNIQIAAALRAAANVQKRQWMRIGYRKKAARLLKTRRLTSAALRIALPFLVETCDICGETALYMIGLTGRCQKHRLTGAVEAYRGVNQRKDAQTARMNVSDRRLRSSETRVRQHAEANVRRGHHERSS